MNTLEVFFDGSCPLCRREIDHYRKVHALSPLVWTDIGAHPARLSDVGIRYIDAMKVLHVRTHRGEWYKGAYAFLAIWRALKGYRHLAHAIETLRLPSLLDKVYYRFANWRYDRRCASGQCGLPHD